MDEVFSKVQHGVNLDHGIFCMVGWTIFDVGAVREGNGVEFFLKHDLVLVVEWAALGP